MTALSAVWVSWGDIGVDAATSIERNVIAVALAVANGTVFFSSSTASAVAQHQDGFYDTMRSFLLNMCCGDHTGRLLAYDPSTGQTGEIVSGLWYANGVAIAHDEKSVLVRRPCGILLFVSVIAVPTIASS